MADRAWRQQTAIRCPAKAQPSAHLQGAAVNLRQQQHRQGGCQQGAGARSHGAGCLLVSTWEDVVVRGMWVREPDGLPRKHATSALARPLVECPVQDCGRAGVGGRRPAVRWPWAA